MKFPNLADRRRILVGVGAVVIIVAIMEAAFGFTKYVAPVVEPVLAPFAELRHTPTRVPEKEITRTPSPTRKPEGTRVATATMVVPATPAQAPSATPVPADTATATDSPTATIVSTFAPTDSPTATIVSTLTPIVSTSTPSATLPSTATGVPSATPSPTPSSTPLPSATVLPTPSVVATSTVLTTPPPVTGPVHYVSKLGSNADGSSWATAWTDFASINYAVVKPGDTILVDGGSSQMVYTTQLAPTGSGFTIRLAPDAGRNGQVVIFGGRSSPLPYCEQPSYTYQTVGVRTIGVELGGASSVTLDGTKWRGILITGNNWTGVALGGSNNRVRYAEITDNGQANFTTTNNWRPDGPGVNPSGVGNALDHDIIHDNGQDSLQTGSSVTNMTISYDWHYNARTHPVYGVAVPWNYCMHSDGFQIYAGGVSSGISIDHTILGPGHMQGVILGQTPGRSQVNNVTFSNDLVIGDFNAGLMDYAQTGGSNWTIDHTTIYMPRSPNWVSGPGTSPGTGWNETFVMDGSGHHITNTVAWDGRAITPGTSVSNNCEWSPYGNHHLLSGSIGGINADPQFVSPPPLTSPDATGGSNGASPTSPTMADFVNANFAIGGGACSGLGSSITSVAMLLAQ